MVKRTVRGTAPIYRPVGIIDEADARLFKQANRELMKEVSSSKAKAIEILKESGFLTKSGKVSKRYR